MGIRCLSFNCSLRRIHWCSGSFDVAAKSIFDGALVRSHTNDGDETVKDNKMPNANDNFSHCLAFCVWVYACFQHFACMCVLGMWPMGGRRDTNRNHELLENFPFRTNMPKNIQVAKVYYVLRLMCIIINSVWEMRVCTRRQQKETARWIDYPSVGWVRAAGWMWIAIFSSFVYPLSFSYFSIQNIYF